MPFFSRMINVFYHARLLLWAILRSADYPARITGITGSNASGLADAPDKSQLGEVCRKGVATWTENGKSDTSRSSVVELSRG